MATTKEQTNSREPTSGRDVAHVAITSADIVGDSIARFDVVFPEAIVEGKVDFEKLRSLLGGAVDGRAERYSFTWAGRRDAIQVLQMPSRASLAPNLAASIDFERTGNVFIEGDNLEVLKLLYRPYFGRVKVIYIDPPYNTGSDLVYADDYADPLDAYLKLTGQKDAEGNLLTSNPETSGRYHSTWLSMMYPRLFLARQLLRDDGVIFVSIDDHEHHNLRMLMNDLFGEENFLGNVVRATGTTTGQDSRGFGSSFDYLLAYSKSTGYEVGGLPLSEKDAERFNLEDKRGKYSLLQLRKTGNNDRREDRPFMYYPVEAPDGTQVFPIGPGGYESCWRCGPATYKKILADDFIVWKKVAKNEGERWTPYVKYYLEGREKRPSPLWNDLDGNKKATIEVKELLGEKIFSNPKPTALVCRILEISTEPDTDDIVLDFFAGSGTSAHAVLAMNRRDGGNRRFICVQLPEPTPVDSAARRAGYENVAAICEGRIRKVINKLGASSSPNPQLKGLELTEDMGFRVFGLSASNFRPWAGVKERDPDSYAKQMAWFADNLVDGWTVEKVIWEVAIKEGFGLSSRLERVDSAKLNEVWRVTDADKSQSFTICLDSELNPETPSAIDLTGQDLFVCRDVALTDSLAANLSMQCRLKTI
jgi:adenine-specific DNA-methyltransferase